MIPAASALLAFRANGAPVPQPAFTEAGFAIAVQCWSLKEFTLFEAIEMAAAAGMGGVEVYKGQLLGGDHGDVKFGPDLADDKVQALLDHLKKNNLVAVNFGVTDIPKDEAEARKTFELAKKLGLYGVSTESLGSLDTLEKLAKEYDIKVCFHNHPKPTALWNPDTIWKAIEGRHANIGYCADIGHWASSGLDPLEVIKKIAPRVHAFHMKDRASISEAVARPALRHRHHRHPRHPRRGPQARLRRKCHHRVRIQLEDRISPKSPSAQAISAPTRSCAGDIRHAAGKKVESF